jgi:hypothetical protein
MLGKLDALMLTAIAVFSLVVPGPCEARAKRVKPLDDSIYRVKTRIILNYKNSGQDVCIVHNSNNRPVVVFAEAFPAGPFTDSTDTATVGPAYLQAFEDDDRFYGWYHPPRPPTCTLKSSQYQ